MNRRNHLSAAGWTTFLLSWPAVVHAFVAGASWPLPAIYFHTGIVDMSGNAAAPSGETWTSAFERAMADWSASTNFQFYAVSGHELDPCENDGLNGVGFRTNMCDGFDFGGSTVAITLYSFTGEDQLTEADIIFNASESWDIFSWPFQVGDTDFHRVALHELGHAIGLGHTAVSPAIMRPLVSSLNDLQQDDIAGANFLYSALLPGNAGAAQNAYFPLPAGAQWQYEDQNSEPSARVVLDGLVDLGGVPARALLYSDNTVRLFRDNSQSLELMRQISQGLTLDFTPPMTILSADPMLGDTLTTNGTTTASGSVDPTVTLDYTVVAQLETTPDVATPFGILPAIKLALEIDFGFPENFFSLPTTSMHWLIDNLGVARESVTDDSHTTTLRLTGTSLQVDVDQDIPVRALKPEDLLPILVPFILND